MAEENKIYVGGLALETTSESLRDYFATFGEITDCIVMPDKVTGRSRCFGFVSFKDPSAMNAALGTANVVDGREVSVKKAVRENPAAMVDSGGGIYNSIKIFVGGLPATCDYDKFTAYFSRFGQIEDAVVMMDNLTQRHRGFGYVTFSDTSAVEAAIQNYSANQIDGKWVEVKRCIPQDKMAPGQSFKGKGKGFGRGAEGKGKVAYVVPPPNAALPAVGYGYGMQHLGGAGYGHAASAYGGGGAYGSYGGVAYGSAYGAGYGAAAGAQQQRYGGYRSNPY